MPGPHTIRRMLLRGAVGLLLLIACPLLRGHAEAAITCTL